MQPWENFSQFELAWTSFDCPAWLIRERNTNEKNKIHPTQKSLTVIQAVVQRFAKPGDIILDTHAGSGTTLVAAYRTGHRYIGCEIDGYYYEKAMERIQNEESQMNIFRYMESMKQGLLSKIIPYSQAKALRPEDADRQG